MGHHILCPTAQKDRCHSTYGNDDEHEINRESWGMRLSGAMSGCVSGLVTSLRLGVLMRSVVSVMLIAQLKVHRAGTHAEPHPECVIRRQQSREHEKPTQP